MRLKKWTAFILGGAMMLGTLTACQNNSGDSGAGVPSNVSSGAEDPVQAAI